MAKKNKTIVGNMLIAQSGGPGSHQPKFGGAVLQAKKHKEIKKSMARCTAFKEFG